MRVRVRLAGAAGFLTLKGPPARGGVCREEFEYPIPPEDAERTIRMKRCMRRRGFSVR